MKKRICICMKADIKEVKNKRVRQILNNFCEENMDYFKSIPYTYCLNSIIHICIYHFSGKHGSLIIVKFKVKILNF